MNLSGLFSMRSRRRRVSTTSTSSKRLAAERVPIKFCIHLRCSLRLSPYGVSVVTSPSPTLSVQVSRSPPNGLLLGFTYISPANVSVGRLEYLDERLSKSSKATSLSLIMTIVVPRDLTELMGPVDHCQLHASTEDNNCTGVNTHHIVTCASPNACLQVHSPKACQEDCRLEAEPSVREGGGVFAALARHNRE